MLSTKNPPFALKATASVTLDPIGVIRNVVKKKSAGRFKSDGTIGATRNVVNKKIRRRVSVDGKNFGYAVVLLDVERVRDERLVSGGVQSAKPQRPSPMC